MQPKTTAAVISHAKAARTHLRATTTWMRLKTTVHAITRLASAAPMPPPATLTQRPSTMMGPVITAAPVVARSKLHAITILPRWKTMAHVSTRVAWDAPTKERATTIPSTPLTTDPVTTRARAARTWSRATIHLQRQSMTARVNMLMNSTTVQVCV